MKNILFLFTICAFAYSCNTSNKTATATTPSTTAISLPDKPDELISGLDDDPLFYLHRESCRGPCPGYTYTVFGSGKVDYFGQRNVDRVGNFIAEMDKATLTSLIKAANEFGVKKMDDEYADNKMADIPRWTLKYKDKSIKFMEYKAPEELKAICKKLDDTLDNLTWEKVD